MLSRVISFLRATCKKSNRYFTSARRASKMTRWLYVGPMMHMRSSGELEIIKRAGILVEDGKIVSVTENPQATDVGTDHVRILGGGKFMIPGLIDCHIHAPQMPNLGIGLDRNLLEWLETYTFPLEKRYADDEFAERIFDAVVKRTLSVGTTTACYFGSLYASATLTLAKKAAEFGQRAFVGKLNMNFKRDDGYCETTEESVASTRQFVKDVVDIGSPLVKPIITPRFALSCDMELLTELGKLARESDVHVQSHVSEDLAEIAAVKRTYDGITTYSEVYDAAGLLTSKTVLAHGVHLQDSELKLLKERETAIIHCPASNTCLRSGLCDVRRLMAAGIKIGLGTDVAGGPSVCILDAMRSALVVSNHLAILKPDYEPLKCTDVFYLATLGGAKSLAIDDQVGNFEPGKQFDALVIDVRTSPDDLLVDLDNFTLENKLQKLIYSGDDRNIVEVYVAGRRVK